MLTREIRREPADQRAAAHGQLLLIQRVEALPSLLTYMHQSSFFQAFQVVAHCRLLNLAAKHTHQIVDAKPFAAQLEADLLARVVAQRFGEIHEVYAHALTMIDHVLQVKSNCGLKRGNNVPYSPLSPALVEPVLSGCEPLRHKQGRQRQHDQDESSPNRRADVALEYAVDQQRHRLRPAL